MMGGSTYRKEVLTCLLIALGTLVVWGVFALRTFSPVDERGMDPGAHAFAASDSQEYVGLAKTMLSAHRFALTPNGPPDAFRTPGYPAFVAATLYLFGSFNILIALQILLGAFSCVLIYLLGARYFSRGIGLFAAIVYTLDPTTMFLASTVLSETLYMFLFLLAVFLVAQEEGRRRIWLLALSGILVGLGALTRPVGLYIIPLIALFSALQPQQNIRRAFTSAAVVLIAAALTIAPWILHNGLTEGAWSLSSITGYNLLIDAEQFEAYTTGKSVDEIAATYQMQLGITTFAGFTSFAAGAQEKKMAEAIILPQLPRYTYFHIIKTAPFFLSSSVELFEESPAFPLPFLVRASTTPVNISSMVLSGNLSGAVSALMNDPLALSERLFWLAVTVLAFFYSLITLYLRPAHWRAVLVFFLVVGFFAMLAGPLASARYRVPAEPFLLLLGGAGFAALIRQLRSRFLRRKN